jgi:putative heme-binding domain-containing protein
MRVIATLILLATVGAAGVADVFTQPPTVAPSVERGAAPATQQILPPSWTQKFTAGQTPLWIWGADTNKRYLLQKEFTAAGVKAAKLRVTCDNHVKLSLNNVVVANSDEWQTPVEADVTGHLKAGANVLVADVRNDGGAAGFVLKLVMETDKGMISVVSDLSWTAAEKRGARPGPVKKTGTYGEKPWGSVFDQAQAASTARVPPNTFEITPGFKVEKLFTVPRNELGSWVSLTTDDKGRLIASDQGNLGLVRITPGRVGTDEPTKVERLKIGNLTGAQGLLWAHGCLYVCCNGGPGSGLYRVKAEGDGFGPVEKLKAIQGGGEHGPHGLRLAPDGKSILVVCGNHTQPIANFDHSRVPKNWAEDLLLPRQWDANGHARGILAPGGYVAKTDPDGKTWEIVTTGYRNSYDMAVNADGELFVYDSDMEWDMGMPWYRPTRVSHSPGGSELGWRSGTGVWPAHHLDSLPAMTDIGPGSPVGVEFGYGAKFPAKYQKALFICDWTFGTIYALHLTPKGATYTAAKEEFLSRTPLPMTDIVINPADGALYFTIGGRGTQSELFRVTYVGKEPTAKVEYKDPREAELRELRKKLEAYHEPAADPAKAVEFILPHLGHEDRFIRYAARVALEHQPVKLWQDKVLAEVSVKGTLNGVVALARQGDKSFQPKLLAALDRFVLLTDDDVRKYGVPTPGIEVPLNALFVASNETWLDLVRTYSLVFIRMGEPDKETAARLAKKLDRHFPESSDVVNRELIQLLVYLKSPTVLAKGIDFLKQPSLPLTAAGMEELLARNRGYGGNVARMLANSVDQQKMAYAFALRNVKDGWTLDQRRAYTAFLAEAQTKSGGASYQGFVTNTYRDYLDNASEADRKAIEAAGLGLPYKGRRELPKAAGPGKEWTVADLVALEPKLRKGRNFKNGEKMYAATRCVVCHRFGGDGGATGPDLTQLAGRFTLKDLSESIVEPSKVVSDQYKASVVTTAAGKTITGRVVSETGGKLVIVTDPEDPTKVVEVAKDDVESVKPSAVSLMPEKLIQPLNEAEVLDLLAYLLSRGDPAHPMFRK